jgi:hypothetical protein
VTAYRMLKRRITLGPWQAETLISKRIRNNKVDILNPKRMESSHGHRGLRTMWPTTLPIRG